MSALPVADTPAIDSLSPRQIDELLRTLRSHNELLDSAYHDARRLALDSRRPGYLLDFDLLNAYMYQSVKRLPWLYELEYLLGDPDTLMIIGPGTTLEIDRHLAGLGLRLDSDGHIRANSRAVSTHLTDRAHVAIIRLADVLAMPNVHSYPKVVSDGHVHAPAYKVTRAVLVEGRTQASPDANDADALNWAAVVHMRREIATLNLTFYPYLLTGTRPLLDPRLWSNEIGAPLSRHPAEAIYTELLFDHFGDDPHDAMNHTVQVSYQAALLEQDLKSGYAQTKDRRWIEGSEWEQAVAHGRVGDGLRAQLGELARFVQDPVVRAAQRMYDNARMESVSTAEQYGELVQSFHDTPSKLFDLIVDINAALSTSVPGAAGLANLWDTVLRIDSEAREPGVMEFRVLSSNGADEYVSAELQAAPADDHPDSRPLWVFRWPSSLDAHRIVGAFSQAFERHSISRIDVTVGAPRQLAEYSVDVPVTLADLVAGAAKSPPATAPSSLDKADVSEGAGAPSDDVDRDRPFTWLRMNGEVFDLYADVAGGSRGRRLVGVFAADVIIGHLADLYFETCSRYIFRSWLEEALREVLSRADDLNGTDDL